MTQRARERECAMLRLRPSEWMRVFRWFFHVVCDGIHIPCAMNNISNNLCDKSLYELLNCSCKTCQKECQILRLLNYKEIVASIRSLNDVLWWYSQMVIMMKYSEGCCCFCWFVFFSFSFLISVICVLWNESATQIC